MTAQDIIILCLLHETTKKDQTNGCLFRWDSLSLLLHFRSMWRFKLPPSFRYFMTSTSVNHIPQINLISWFSDVVVSRVRKNRPHIIGYGIRKLEIASETVSSFILDIVILDTYLETIPPTIVFNFYFILELQKLYNTRSLFFEILRRLDRHIWHCIQCDQQNVLISSSFS